jgi:thioredoxin 1
MARIVTEENFNETFNEGKPVVLDFWAEWCAPCRMIGPIIDELASKYEGRVIIGKVDVDENDAIATQFGIRNVPTVLFFKEGQIVDKLVGAIPKATYIEKIEQLL